MKYLQDYFYYTRQERLGACFLMFISISFFILPKFYDFFHVQPKIEFDLKSYQEEVIQFELVLEKQQKSLKKKIFSAVPDSTKSPVKLTPFDPNTANLNELRKLGIPNRVAYTLINYRKKGGVFRKKEDLKRIYGLNIELYEKLTPYIRIKLKKKAKKQIIAHHIPKDIPKSFEKITVKVDINKANADEWQKLRGIGPVLSKRIVKFREKLGGFIKIGQVAETYGLPDSTFQKIQPLLINSEISQKISINTIAEEELKQHPYISWKQAKIIILYRDNHGPFKGIGDLSRVEVLSEKDLNKLEPYLSFE